jgi:hypothetical protein
MRSKVSSDWLPSYTKAMQPVLGIFKMDGYFPGSPCTAIPAYMYRYYAVVTKSIGNSINNNKHHSSASPQLGGIVTASKDYQTILEEHRLTQGKHRFSFQLGALLLFPVSHE